MKTLILGGGLCGVTLARILSQKGEDVTVLEQEPVPGGLCRSQQTNGFTFDIGGSHIIFSRDTEVLRFIHDVLGANRAERVRNTKIFYKGRYVKYPFENALHELSKEDCYNCLHEFIKALIASEKGDMRPPCNFEEWILQTFGKGIADAYLIPYNTKIWNYPPHLMSAHWMEGRVPRPPVEDIIKSAVGIETEGYTHQAVFSYPVTGGIEALIHAIAAPVRERILTGFRVTHITEKTGGYEVSDGVRTLNGDRIISTIPLQNLISCLSSIPDDVMQAVAALKYNSVMAIGIGIKGEVPPYSWTYIPDAHASLANRISFPSNFSKTTAPYGCSSVLAEITYNEGDKTSRMTDDEVTSHIISSLSSLGLFTPDQVVTTQITRNKFAYVVYDLDYIRNITIIRQHFKSRGIPLVGRFSQFEYLNMDGIIRSVLNYVNELA
ncbi:MAG TPA: FAD-dependent oxidoreductase [Methanospirillum sp.]|uniref:protoporphyrinogen/coproporphyrinogen oxidase n=1 Tax=Methanospirillum sp. TaxID=45200 RepID=UPI002B89EAB5|nr:FAD-dependent oxidoreductase [Methanospirillum sp.]HOJ96041.1 FAD-dependent oxidoreductase [Methanospirillum sp.]HOL40793.1 FAD-dependent oxidoreductase [Methanospirillum sp.]HPP77080.1 FAD-dependent oxidoreductase [Methanospirillum sp.]